MSYKWNKGVQFYLGVNNVFDTAATAIVSGLLGSTTSAETDAST